MFEVYSMDAGVINLAALTGNTLPAGVVTTAANVTANQTGSWRTLSGAMYDIEYKSIIPTFQIDGTTTVTGSVVITFTFNDAVGGTGATVETITMPSQAANTVKTYRFALPQGAKSVRMTSVVTGNIGQPTMGYTIGGKRINRSY